MSTASVREEIARQQRLDKRWGSYQDTLAARLVAVVGAQRAFGERQLGADWALRQSLIDLVSVCELLVAELNPPDVEHRRRSSGRSRTRAAARRTRALS